MTIGQIVHFKNPNGEVVPAIVVKINSDNTVNLQVFQDHYGSQIQHKTSVKEGQDKNEWSWPQMQDAGTKVPDVAAKVPHAMTHVEPQAAQEHKDREKKFQEFLAQTQQVTKPEMMTKHGGQLSELPHPPNTSEDVKDYDNTPSNVIDPGAEKQKYEE